MNLKKIKRKYRGLSFDRIRREEKERVFAEEWQTLNEDRSSGVPSLLSYLLAADQRFPQVPSPRDHEVAATVIQWLGSEVGSAWLAEVQEKLPQPRLIARQRIK